MRASSPREYVTGDYLDYQRAYSLSPRESDRVLIDLVGGLVPPRGAGASLLDVGCNSGNLLRHLRAALPDLGLSGAEVFPELVQACSADPDLAGMRFEVMDVRAVGDGPLCDVVTASAVLVRFTRAEFRACLAGLARRVRPGGWLVLFDWYHRHEQELTMTEVTPLHPEGLTLAMRPFSTTTGDLVEAGFEPPDYHPFHMPFDLPAPPEGSPVMITHTMPGPRGRESVRGSLLQPWCHVVARRAG